MTATEELRKLLDERGVEWGSYDEFEPRTQWEAHDGAFLYWARERNGMLLVETTAPEKCSLSTTPEQAIAVTLGKEPDDTAMLKLHDRMNTTLLEYERALGGEKVDGAITVTFVAEMHRLLEEAATLGTSTCSIEQTCHERIAGFDAYHDEFVCSKCGGDMYEYFNYCPNCGAKVVCE